MEVLRRLAERTIRDDDGIAATVVAASRDLLLCPVPKVGGLKR